MRIRRLGGQGQALYYPDSVAAVDRLPNGDVRLANGSILPKEASCPPDYTWDLASGTCVPYPGAENVNFQCGGVLAPWGSNGCRQDDGGLLPAPIAPAPAVVAQSLFTEETDRYMLWSACHPVSQTLDEWAASLPSSCASAAGSPASSGGGGLLSLGAFGCLIVGLAVFGAAADVLGRGGR